MAILFFTVYGIVVLTLK